MKIDPHCRGLTATILLSSGLDWTPRKWRPVASSIGFTIVCSLPSYARSIVLEENLIGLIHQMVKEQLAREHASFRHNQSRCREQVGCRHFGRSLRDEIIKATAGLLLRSRVLLDLDAVIPQRYRVRQPSRQHWEGRWKPCFPLSLSFFRCGESDDQFGPAWPLKTGPDQLAPKVRRCYKNTPRTKGQREEGNRGD